MGLFFYGLDQGTEALGLGRDLVATVASDVTVLLAGLSAPPAPFVPEQFRLMPGYALVVVGFGPAQEHGRIVGRIRGAGPPLFDFVTPMPYVQLQRMFDETYRWGLHVYEKALYLEELSDQAIAVITEQQPGKSGPLSALLMYGLGTGYSEVGEDDYGRG